MQNCQIRRYKQSSFPLLSVLDDSGQHEQRSSKSRFQRPPENGRLKGTILPPIVVKQSLVASSQEERNLGHSLISHDFEAHREHAPSRHHPNKGKRSRGGIFDSDLEQRIAPISGQNSKPLSKQKLRKRKKRARNGNDLFDEVELIILDKMLHSESTDKRPSSARRRHKSHVRESPDNSQADKTNRTRRIQSCDRAPGKAPKTKSLAEVKEVLRNPKTHSDDSSLKKNRKQSKHISASKEGNCSNPQRDKRWKEIVAKHRHRQSSAAVQVDDLPADFWEEECRIANELTFCLNKTESKKRTDEKRNADDVGETEHVKAEQRRTKKASTNHTETYIKFQNSHRFVTGLNQNEKKKLRHFTQLINDKVRKKSAEILLDRSDDKSKHRTVEDATTHDHDRISPLPTKVGNSRPANSANMLSNKPKSRQRKDGVTNNTTVQYSTGHMKLPETGENNTGKKINTAKSFKNSSANDIKKSKRKENNKKLEYEKEIPNVCRKSKNSLEKKRNKIDGKISENVDQIKKVKSKQKEKESDNDNVKDSAKIMSTAKTSKRNKISKNFDTPGKHTTSKQKSDCSVPSEPQNVVAANVKSKEHFDDTPVTSVSERSDAKRHETVELKYDPVTPDTSLLKRKSLPKRGTLLPNVKPTGKSYTTNSRKVQSEKATACESGRKARAKLNTSMPGTLNCTKSSGVKSNTVESQTTATAKSTKPVSEREVSGIRDSPVSRKHATAFPGRKAATKTNIHVSKRETAIPVSERKTSAMPVTNALGRSSKAKHDMQMSSRTKVVGRQAAVIPTTELSRINALQKQPKGNSSRHEQGRPASTKFANTLALGRPTSGKADFSVSGETPSAKTDTSFPERPAPSKYDRDQAPARSKERSNTPVSGRPLSANADLSAMPLSAKAKTHVSGRTFLAKADSRMSGKPLSAKADTHVLGRPLPAKADAPVSERLHSAKEDIPVSGKPRSILGNTPVSGRPISTKTDSPSGRPNSAKADTPVSVRPLSAKADTPVSGRSHSTKGITPVSERPPSAKGDTFVSGRPLSAKAHTPVSRRSHSVKTDNPLSERPASAKTDRRPASAKTEVRPASIKTDRRPVSAKTEEKPASVKSDRRPTSAKTVERPSSVRTDRRPDSAKTGKRPASVKNDRRPASANTEERASSVKSDRRPASAKTEERPTSVKSDTRPTTAKTEERPTSIKTDRRPASAKTEEIPVSAKTEERPVSAKTEERPVSLKSDRRPASAKTEERPASAKINRRPASTKTEERPASAKTDRRPDSAKTEERPASVKIDRRQASAKTEKRPASVKTDRRPASAKTEERQASAKNDRRPAPANKTEERRASAKTEERPALVKRDRRPASAKTEERPASAKTHRRPASAKTKKRPASTKTDRRPASTKTEERPASTKTDRRPASTKTEERPTSLKTDRRPASTKTEKRPASVKADRRPASAKTDQRPASAKTELRPASMKTDQRPASAKTITPLSGRPCSSKSDRGPTSAKTVTPLSGRPGSANTDRRPALAKTITPLSGRPGSSKSDRGPTSAKTVTQLSGRPDSTKIDTSLSGRPVSAKTYFSGSPDAENLTTLMPKRLLSAEPATPVSRRPTSTWLLTPASGGETSRKPEGLDFREHKSSARTRSRTGAMASVSHVTMSSRASTTSTNMSSGSQNDMYDDDFEYESAPSRSSLSESYDNIRKYQFD